MEPVAGMRARPGPGAGPAQGGRGSRLGPGLEAQRGAGSREWRDLRGDPGLAAGEVGTGSGEESRTQRRAGWWRGSRPGRGAGRAWVRAVGEGRQASGSGPESGASALSPGFHGQVRALGTVGSDCRGGGGEPSVGHGLDLNQRVEECGPVPSVGPDGTRPGGARAGARLAGTRPAQTWGRGLARRGRACGGGGPERPAASALSAFPGCGLPARVLPPWLRWGCCGCWGCRGPGARRRRSACTWAAAAGVSCASSARPRGGTCCECTPPGPPPCGLAERGEDYRGGGGGEGPWGAFTHGAGLGRASLTEGQVGEWGDLQLAS